MGRAMTFEFFLAPESAVGVDFVAAERRPTRDVATIDAEAWARRAMAASGFGDGEAAQPAIRPAD